jgi:hypothetical protein
MNFALLIVSYLLAHVALLGAGYCLGRIWREARSPVRRATLVDAPGVTRVGVTRARAVARDDGDFPLWVEVGGGFVFVPAFLEGEIERAEKGVD